MLNFTSKTLVSKVSSNCNRFGLIRSSANKIGRHLFHSPAAAALVSSYSSVSLASACLFQQTCRNSTSSSSSSKDARSTSSSAPTSSSEPAPPAEAAARATEEVSAEEETKAPVVDENGEPPQKDEKSLKEGKIEEPLWANCDTVEDILDEEKYGTEQERAEATVEPLHVAMAVKALVYGTILAIFGVGVIALAMMKFFEFDTLEQVLDFVGSKDKRQMEEMKKEGIEVVEFNFDLSKPNEVPQQFSELWEKIVEISGVDLDADDDDDDDKNNGDKKTRKNDNKKEEKQ